jgi:hypothetical protein
MSFGTLLFLSLSAKTIGHFTVQPCPLFSVTGVKHLNSTHIFKPTGISFEVLCSYLFVFAYLLFFHVFQGFPSGSILLSYFLTESTDDLVSLLLCH